MKKNLRANSSHQFKKNFDYLTLEKRELLACDHIGGIGPGVLVADDAMGPGYIMYSQEDVQTRFSMPFHNSQHFVAVRIHGNDWQFNNDVQWIDFEPEATDRLITEVNFTGDSVSNSVPLHSVNGIQSASRFGNQFDLRLAQAVESDIWVNANRFLGAPNEGEFEVLGTCFDTTEDSALPTGVDSSLQQILTGLFAYESIHGTFPSIATFDTAGQTLLSWRVEILPYLGFSDLYSQFNRDEPWHSPHNLGLIGEMPDIFASPNVNIPGRTPFQGVAGEGNLFRPSGIATSLNQVQDGLAKTLAVVESDANRAVVWTQPDGLSFNALDPFAGLGENGQQSFHGITLSGDVLEIAPDSDPTAFANLLQIDDGNLIDLSEYQTQTLLTPQKKLGQAAIGLLNYESAFQELPAHAIYDAAGTTPLLSWRVAILPFIGEQLLYDQFNLDEPWNSPNNLSLLPFMPSIYVDAAVPDGFTNVLATSGSGTIFELDDSSVSLGGIQDGASNTTVAVRANPNLAVEWTRPVDWVFDPTDPTDGLLGTGNRVTGQLPRGFDVAFVDGSVRKVRNNIPDADFTAMVLRSDGMAVDFDSAPQAFDAENSLRQLGLATLNFESAYGEFPAHAIYSADGTQPLLSWRVGLLPFIGHENLYNQFNFDEAWDSPHNLSLLEQMPEVFKSPGIADGLTSFLAVTGENTMFPISESGVRRVSISDPSGQTILFVQADDSEAVEWTRPSDLEFSADQPSNGLGDATGSGFQAVMVDGQARFVHDSIADATVAALIQRNDGTLIEESIDAVPNSLELSNFISNRLRQVALAHLNHESAFQELPSHAIYSEDSIDGVPLLSWRVTILPFIEYGHLYDQFNLDEPWDSPHNLSLLPLMPDIFAHPNVPNHMTLTQVVTSPLANPDTAYPIDPSGSSLGRITDGLSQTIGVLTADVDQAVEWTKPQDIFYNDTDPNSDPYNGIGEAFFGVGTHFARVDGSVGFLQNCVPPEILRLWLLANDGQVTPDLDCPAPVPMPLTSQNGHAQLLVTPFDEGPAALGATITTNLGIDFERLALVSKRKDPDLDLTANVQPEPVSALTDRLFEEESIRDQTDSTGDQNQIWSTIDFEFLD